MLMLFSFKFTFPTAKKQPEERQIGLRHLSRADPGHSHRHLEPKKDHRVSFT